MMCIYCNGECSKRGFSKLVQRYKCRDCQRYQQASYTYNRCTEATERMIITLNNEGVGICGIGRITGISKAHVVNKIRELARKVQQQPITGEGACYEVDEMQTYIGASRPGHQVYVIYALERESRRIAALTVGRRTTENIRKVVSVVQAANASKIYTDGLNIYPSLIPPGVHVRSHYKISRIERANLTMRTRLKRLSRRTICYSKSLDMLECCLRLYAWGG